MSKETTADAEKRSKLTKFSAWHWLVIGLVLGVLGFIGVRMATAKNPNVHYHANFALYVNGQQDVFNGPGYYEEVAACDVNNANDLKSRAHMHDNINHVIHIHANGVSWSDFFNNLGYSLGDTALTTANGTFVDGQSGNHLIFILNGKQVDTIANTVIQDRDVLLINYGNDSDQVSQQRYNKIPHDAVYYDTHKDPAACSGGAKFNLEARFKDAVGLTRLYSE